MSHHNGHCDRDEEDRRGEPNMEVVDLDDDQTTYRCHCGTEFSAPNDGSRPECPICECPYFASKVDYEQCRREHFRKNIPKPPKAYRYFAMYARDQEGKEHQVCIGASEGIFEFMVQTGVNCKGMDTNGISIRELTEEEYLDAAIAISDRNRSKVINLGGFIGRIIGEIEGITREVADAADGDDDSGDDSGDDD